MADRPAAGFTIAGKSLTASGQAFSLPASLRGKISKRMMALFLPASD
jgi:hypothetical protein